VFAFAWVSTGSNSSRGIVVPSKVYLDDDCSWRVQFIQPAIFDNDRCVLLYGPNGEIVGPLTMEQADTWLNYFDNRQQRKEPAMQSATTA
jgi:hypothetical protein